METAYASFGQIPCHMSVPQAPLVVDQKIERYGMAAMASSARVSAS
jgi:hypothetical protein